jgi:hypothetical protein
MGLTSDKNFQHSCEVYRRSGGGTRHVVYGRTRDEVVRDEHFIAKLFRQAPCPLDGTDRDDLLFFLEDDWQDDVVVTATRSTAMGLGPAWARVARRFDEYGERV